MFLNFPFFEKKFSLANHYVAYTVQSIGLAYATYSTLAGQMRVVIKSLFYHTFYQSNWINSATGPQCSQHLARIFESSTKVRTLESILIYTTIVTSRSTHLEDFLDYEHMTDDCANGPTVCLIDSHAWQSLFNSPPWGQVWRHWQWTIHCIYPGNVIACDT